MKEPSRSSVEIATSSDGNTMTLHVGDFDVSLLGNGFLYPCGPYSVASFQLIDKTTTTLSTGVVTLMCANDPAGDIPVAHPSSVTLSAAGMSKSAPLEHGYVGCQVTTVQASVACELWMVLKR